ncbi:MAG TPA: hypothetical protein VFY36_02085 [Solirubrobacteraceae bacterium]|nr:hypothetical protein [Solirubrobacteraceae bacterium]
MNTTSGAMLTGVAEAEPRRIWFGRGGCVEQHDDGTFAVFVRGELLGIYSSDDVASRDVFIAVVAEQAEREDLALAFRVSAATVGRVITRFKLGGFRAVADYGRRGGHTVRTPKLQERLAELFEKGLGPRAAHRAVAKKASYGTVYAIHQEWLAARAATSGTPAPAPVQAALTVVTASEASLDHVDAPAALEAAEVAPVQEVPGEPTLEAVVPPTGAVVQHVGSWLLLGLLHQIGFYALAAHHRGEVALASLRPAIDAAAIALALGEKCVEGVRRLATPSVDTLLRHAGGVSASWVRRVLHDFADAGSDAFPGAVASRLLSRAGEGEDRVWLYVDNHMRPYTGQHVIRKGWRMQDKRAVPGTTDYYVHDEEGCPLWRVSTTSHDSLCAWLMPVVEFARLSLGDEVKPVLVFDRGGAFPEMMAELRDEGAEFVTYERKPYPEIGATEFKESLTITLASRPRRPIRIAYTEAPQKNLRAGRGRVRRIALLTEEGAQVNLLAVSELPAETLIRGHLARWGRQENPLKHGVERWGINHLDGRRVEEYPPDALVPNPARRRIDRLLKLSHTTEGEAWRRWARLESDDPEREQAKRDIDRAMDRQRDLIALRAKVPAIAPVSETPLAGKLRRHELAYKNVLDTLRITLANLESDLAVMLARHLDRPREAKKLLATLYAAPGTVRVSSRGVTVRLAPAATESERLALRALLRDVTRLRLALPGDPDRRRLRWVLT